MAMAAPCQPFKIRAPPAITAVGFLVQLADQVLSSTARNLSGRLKLTGRASIHI
jgi:hypothetical protein